MALCLSLLLAACESGLKRETAETAPTGTAAKAPPATASGSYDVTDALGRKLHFSNPPQRIALAGRALFMVADALYMFPGSASRIVATGNAGQEAARFAALMNPDAAAKTVFAEIPGPEQIAEVKPDLVILKSYLAQSLGSPLETLGIPVLYVDLETPDQYYRDLVTLGQVLQQEKRGLELANLYRSRVTEIRTRLANLTDQEKPRVLFLYSSVTGGRIAFNVPPASWIQTQMVEIAGGAPVWKNANPGRGWASVTLEQILAWNPAVLFVVSYAGNPSETVQGLRSDPIWQRVQALKSGKVFAFPGDFCSWDQPSPRWILGLSWMAARLHPKIFPKTDTISAAEAFYLQAYGLDDSIFRAKIRPLLRGDLP